jgi:hypothetical protein
LLGTIDLGLWYPKFTSLDLVSYSDVDFAGCKIDRKSTSGTCHFLGHLFLGLAKSKTQLLSPLLKQNILPRAVVMLKLSI